MERPSASVERLWRRIERERRARLEAEAIAEQATRAALHDALTGLPNRMLVLDRLSTALERGERSGTHVALFFIDLDRFKLINDSFGHDAGDRLLTEVARRLLQAARASDTVGRFGGDEFVVLCEHISGRDAALEIARRLAEAISPPVGLAEAELRVQASVGIALSTPGATAEGLIRDCDAAMYHAKDSGRGRCEFFEESVRMRDRNRLELESDLREAVETGAFELHYQPIVGLDTMRVVGIESLVRWRHPTRGLLPPAEFIPLAEETGLIGEIDRWVLTRACEQAVAWRGRYGREACGRLSVNLSARQLANESLDELVGSILARTGFPPEELVLEITESVLVAESAVASENLAGLNRRGIRIAIDDFGTGYCSLAYLRQFSVDTLKIHQSFVAGLDRGGGEAAILTAIVAMGRALGLTVVAEGIEEDKQLAQIRELGCHEAQGFLFAQPLSAAEYAHRHIAGADARVA
jgi:diguanylate cyclase (GGDEF)-like protein